LVTNQSRAAQPAEPPPAETVPQTRLAAAADLVIVIAFFLALYASMPFLDPILRNGRGLAMVFAIAGYQFAFEGVAPLFVMVIRRERFSDYGFTRSKVARSLALGLALAAIYDLAMSWHARALMWIPMRRQPVVHMSLATGFPQYLAGLALTVLAWGFFEGFFGVFFARKCNQALGHSGSGWFSPGVLGFALFNGLIHLTVGQRIGGFVACFASGYAIAVIPAVTRNAWGGPLVQTLTDSVGKL
jgi:hypothetical protein